MYPEVLARLHYRRNPIKRLLEGIADLGIPFISRGGACLTKASRLNPISSRCKSLVQEAIRCTARAIGIALPLSTRKALVASGICRRMPGGLEFSVGILDDLRRQDPDALHRYLWSNHLAYAASYEIPKRFGTSNLNPSRRILFDEMGAYLHSIGVKPHLDVRSAFEVGCSMGYLLRHLEVEVCPSAEILHGLDIDAYAVDAGTAHLRSLQSKVRLHAADLAATERIMSEKVYDLVLCCGVLMYVNENTAEELVRTMLSRAGLLVGVICLAHPGRKRSAREGSETRLTDGAFIHNVHRMIRRAGGRVVSSKRIESSISGSSPSHAILAEPPRYAGRTDGKQRRAAARSIYPGKTLARPARETP